MRRIWRGAIALFAVLGPGFVTASAGNDVGGIATYSAAGAKFGYIVLWTLLPLTFRSSSCRRWPDAWAR